MPRTPVPKAGALPDCATPRLGKAHSPRPVERASAHPVRSIERHNSAVSGATSPGIVPEDVRGAFRLKRFEAVERPNDGVVYFIGGARGPIKIGFTKDLPARLARLQSNSPVKLRVLLAVRGDLGDELEAHGTFREFRLHGEWFKRSPELLSHIDWLVRHGMGLPEPADDTIPAEVFAELAGGIA